MPLPQLEADGREIAVPIEDLCDPDAAPSHADLLQGLNPEIIGAADGGDSPPARRWRRRKPNGGSAGSEVTPRAED